MKSRMILINYLILPIKMIVINIVYEKYDSHNECELKKL